MPIYVKLGSLEGGVTEGATYNGWIEANSMQFGVGRGISTPTGSAADREASAPSVSEVTITKIYDKSSFELFKHAVGSVDKGELMKIHIVKADSGKFTSYVEYEFENTLLSGYSLSTGGDRPTESVSLNFTKIQVKYTPTDKTGTAGTPVTAAYDIALAKLT